MIMKNYVADELANKVYHLTKALNQAESIIKTLEDENNALKEVISKLSEDTYEENDSVFLVGV
jgi:hypothetical protein